MSIFKRIIGLPMKRLSYCRPIVYITVNRPQRMNTSSIWRGRKRNAREREVGNVGADLGGVYQGLAKGAKPPIPMNEPQPVREKLT